MNALNVSKTLTDFFTTYYSSSSESKVSEQQDPLGTSSAKGGMKDLRSADFQCLGEPTERLSEDYFSESRSLESASMASQDTLQASSPSYPSLQGKLPSGVEQVDVCPAVPPQAAGLQHLSPQASRNREEEADRRAAWLASCKLKGARQKLNYKCDEEMLTRSHGGDVGAVASDGGSGSAAALSRAASQMLQEEKQARLKLQNELDELRARLSQCRCSAGSIDLPHPTTSSSSISISADRDEHATHNLPPHILPSSQEQGLARRWAGVKPVVMWEDPFVSGGVLGTGLYIIHVISWAHGKGVPFHLSGVCYTLLVVMLISFIRKHLFRVVQFLLHPSSVGQSPRGALQRLGDQAVGAEREAALQHQREQAIKTLVVSGSRKLSEWAPMLAGAWRRALHALSGDQADTTWKMACLLWLVATVSELQVSLTFLANTCLLSTFSLPVLTAKLREEMAQWDTQVSMWEVLEVHCRSYRYWYVLGALVVWVIHMCAGFMTQAVLALGAVVCLSNKLQHARQHQHPVYVD